MKEVATNEDAAADEQNAIGERIKGDGERVPGVPRGVVLDVFAENPTVKEVAHERGGK